MTLLSEDEQETELEALGRCIPPPSTSYQCRPVSRYGCESGSVTRITTKI